MNEQAWRVKTFLMQEVLYVTIGKMTNNWAGLRRKGQKETRQHVFKQQSRNDKKTQLSFTFLNECLSVFDFVDKRPLKNEISFIGERDDKKLARQKDHYFY